MDQKNTTSSLTVASSINFFSDMLAIAFTFVLVLLLLLSGGEILYSIVGIAGLGSLYALRGSYSCRKLMSGIGYCFLGGSFLATLYFCLPLDVPQTVLAIRRIDILHYTFLLGGMTLLFLFLYLGLKLKKDDCESFLKTTVGAATLILLFLWIRMTLIFISYYLHIASQLRHASVLSILEEFLTAQHLDIPLSGANGYRTGVLAIYYALSGLYLIMGGFAYNKRAVRFGGYALLVMLAFILFKVRVP